MRFKIATTGAKSAIAAISGLCGDANPNADMRRTAFLGVQTSRKFLKRGNPISARDIYLSFQPCVKKLKDSEVGASVIALGIDITRALLEGNDLAAAKDLLQLLQDYLRWGEGGGLADPVFLLAVDVCHAFLNAGELESAANIGVIELVKNIKPTVETLPGFAVVLVQLADRSLDAQQYGAAIGYCEVRLALGEEKRTEQAIRSRIGCLKILGRAYLGLGNDAQLMDDTETAFAWFSKSTKVFEYADDTVGLAKSLRKLGETALTEGDLDQGEHLFQRSREVAEERNLAVEDTTAWPFMFIEFFGVDIIALDTGEETVSIQFGIRNAGTIDWLRTKRLSVAYEWFAERYQEESSISCSLAEDVPSGGQVSIKTKIPLCDARFEGEFRIRLSIDERQLWGDETSSRSYSSQSSGRALGERRYPFLGEMSTAVSEKTVVYSSSDQSFTLVP